MPAIKNTILANFILVSLLLALNVLLASFYMTGNHMSKSNIACEHPYCQESYDVIAYLIMVEQCLMNRGVSGWIDRKRIRLPMESWGCSRSGALCLATILNAFSTMPSLLCGLRLIARFIKSCVVCKSWAGWRWNAKSRKRAPIARCTI